METSELIDRLSQDASPVAPHALVFRLLRGAGVGVVASMLLMLAWLGTRPDLAHAMHTSAYWMKFGYTLALGVFGLWAADRLARPGARARAAAMGIAAAIALLAVVALVGLAISPFAQWPRLILGSSASLCPWRIVALSVPIFAGMFWSLRAFAPTRPALAGAAAGLASGGWGAFIYAFHCDESAAPFVLVFYTLGIALVGVLGALLARRWLEW